MSDRTISYDEWMDTYHPVLVESYSDPTFRNTDPSYIWTEIDGDDGVVIVSGYHFVNRLDHYISDVPVDPNDFVEVD